MTRLPQETIPIEVQLHDRDTPKQIRLNKRYHQVQKVDNHWRVDFNWPHERIWRDYFRIQTTSRLMLTIYHDLITDLWYLQIIFD